MSVHALHVEGLGKRYRIGVHEPEPDGTLARMAWLARAPFKYLIGTLRKPSEAEILWALRNVSFSIAEGEVLGVLGRNGAGKSTLLKLLSRITMPTEGRAVIRGRVGSLLEVGVGLHPDLTGRENIFLKGSFIGMPAREIAAQFDRIVEFADLAKFIDTPVKRYSSGMFVRLGFSVAAHLRPEILIVDEVLSVGDAAFQRRCAERIEEVARSGCTVLIVSHRTGTISSLCSRAIWLDGGTLQQDGPCEEVLDSYLRKVADEDRSVQVSPDGSLELLRVTMRDEEGQDSTLFRPYQAASVEIHLRAHRRVTRPRFLVSIMNSASPLFTASMMLDDHTPHVIEGDVVLRVRFPSLPLMPHQLYRVKVGAFMDDGRTPLLMPKEVMQFQIIGEAGEIGFPSRFADRAAQSAASVLIPYLWELPDGSVHEGNAGSARTLLSEPVETDHDG